MPSEIETERGDPLLDGGLFNFLEDTPLLAIGDDPVNAEEQAANLLKGS